MTETQTQAEPMCWLWPDRTIGKRESRQLREDHNALVNRCVDAEAQRDALLAAAERRLDALEPLLPKTFELGRVNTVARASEAHAAGCAAIALRAAIAAAKP